MLMRSDTKNENKQKLHANINDQPFSVFFCCIYWADDFFVNQKDPNWISFNFYLYTTLRYALTDTKRILHRILMQKNEEWYNQA